MSRQFIVEADGGSRGNPGPAAYGAVVRDAASGAVLVERAEHIGRASNNVAEYRGLIAGLEAVRELDPTARVEARLDSKLVVEQMSGRWQVKHPDMKALVARAGSVLPSGRVRYTWVPRERNAHADRLANEALDAAARGERWDPGASRAELDAGTGAFGADSRSEPRSAAADLGRAAAPAPAPAPARADLGPPTTLLLARHGATQLSEEKRFSGSGGADPPLSEAGQEQCLRLAARLGPARIDAVVTSPLRRAAESADIIASELGITARVEDGWRELAFGAWDGLTYAEVREAHPAELAAWLGSTAAVPPGGESIDTLAARVASARARTAARSAGRTVLVLTHATPVKLVVAAALGAPASAIFRLAVDPGSVTTAQWWADGGASVRGVNDIAHLR